MKYQLPVLRKLSVSSIMFLLGLSIISLTFTKAFADTLEFRNGSKLDGAFVSGTADTVSFNSEGTTKKYSLLDIAAIKFGTQTSPPPPPPPPSAPLSPTSLPLPENGVLPAGSQIMVRMVDNLDTRSHKAGYRFTMAVESDIAEEGAILIPKGTIAYGQLVESKQAGRLFGNSEMEIIITDFMINNQMRPVMTQDIKAVTDKSSSGNKTVKKTGLGAVIGGLIDGSDGAKTGAAIGLGASILTKGDSINIPSGTLLQFRLAQPFKP